MLRGTGSNIYTASLARALAALGHEVHLLCQDRRVRIPGVEIHNPDIGGLLPVYVKDPYEGFEVKTFDELSDDELDRYIEANVAAVRELADSAGGFDAALAGHLVMGPAILARAEVGRFVAKVHGSALEYTVKPHPRFVPYAEEGMEAATAVLVGSRHTAESLWTALPNVPGLREKTRMGPPGVDMGAFRPRVHAAGTSGVVFVGKLIASKGVDLLIGAWPLVLAEHPGARLVIAGYGAFESGLRGLVDALDNGEPHIAQEIAEAGRGLEGGTAEPLTILRGFLANLPENYLEAARGMGDSVEFVGRLEHDQVAELLPGMEALVMPSTFPEAFGMVAAEAAACGVLPISAGHSGMKEVSRELAEALPEDVAELVSFQVGEGAVEAIAERLNRWLGLPDGVRAEAHEALVATARRLWSWEGVARGVLAAAVGEGAENLPPPLQ